MSGVFPSAVPKKNLPDVRMSGFLLWRAFYWRRRGVSPSPAAVRLCRDLAEAPLYAGEAILAFARLRTSRSKSAGSCWQPFGHSQHPVVPTPALGAVATALGWSVGGQQPNLKMASFMGAGQTDRRWKTGGVSRGAGRMHLAKIEER